MPRGCRYRTASHQWNFHFQSQAERSLCIPTINTILLSGQNSRISISLFCSNSFLTQLLCSAYRYQLIRVHHKNLGANCKLLEMFEDTDVILFSVSLTDYDEYIVDSKGVSTNKMLASKNLFENIIDHPSFKKKKFVLILTKFDLLEEKIEHVPLKKCEWFSDFNPVTSHNNKRSGNGNNGTTPSLAQSAFQYIAIKFKRLFHSFTERILFVSLVTGLEPDTVDEALRYGREVIEWEKWDPSIVNEKSEITSTSAEEASSS